MPHVVEYLQVKFSPEVNPHELQFFRDAIVDEMGRLNEEEVRFRISKRYPRIQFKRIGKSPSVQVIGPELPHFEQLAGNLPNPIELANRKAAFSVVSSERLKFWPDRLEKPRLYRLSAWVPVSNVFAPELDYLATDEDRGSFLLGQLRADLEEMFEVLELPMDADAPLRLLSFQEEKTVQIMRRKHKNFNLEFEFGQNLPNWFGLGRYADLGYGTLKAIRPRVRKDEEESVPA